MVIQSTWSLILGCVDVYAMRNQVNLHTTGLIRVFLVGDWVLLTAQIILCARVLTKQVIGILSSAASASAGVTTFFEIDTGACALYKNQLCSYYKVSVILAFITWTFQAASGAAMFWINAAM